MDEEVWSRLSEKSLKKNSYIFADQAKLVSIFIARRFKGLDPVCLAKRLQDFHAASVLLCQGADSRITDATKAALSVIVALASPSKHTVEALVAAIKTAAEQEGNDMVQSFLALPSGKILKKEAIAHVEHRKESDIVTTKIAEVVAKCNSVLGLEAHSPHDAVKIASQHLAAVIFSFVLKAVCCRGPFSL